MTAARWLDTKLQTKSSAVRVRAAAAAAYIVGVGGALCVPPELLQVCCAPLFKRLLGARQMQFANELQHLSLSLTLSANHPSQRQPSSHPTTPLLPHTHSARTDCAHTPRAGVCTPEIQHARMRLSSAALLGTTHSKAPKSNPLPPQPQPTPCTIHATPAAPSAARLARLLPRAP